MHACACKAFTTYSLCLYAAISDGGWPTCTFKLLSWQCREITREFPTSCTSYIKQLCFIFQLANLRMSTVATFTPKPFAEGRFRWAYKGQRTAPRSKAGQEIVVKKYKHTYTWEKSDWNIMKKNYNKAKSLAKAFNKERRARFTIEFVNVAIVQVSSSNIGSTGPKDGEYVTVEDYIPGEFTKWCNNYGQIEPGHPIMPAFMHWTWCHTKGKVMVADLQGVKDVDYDSYRLTDPSILSIKEEYGPTDMGIEGMAMFFLKHKCNPYCRGLPRPTIKDVKDVIPQHMMEQSLALQRVIVYATSYRREIKFSPELKKCLIDWFVSIAKSGEL